MKISYEDLKQLIRDEVQAALETMHSDEMGMEGEDDEMEDAEGMEDMEGETMADEDFEDEEEDEEESDEDEEESDEDEEEDEDLEEAARKGGKKKKKSVKKRKYHGKTYKASAGSLAALKKKPEDVGAFSWADEPWAAKQAATIVKTGKPIKR